MTTWWQWRRRWRPGSSWAFDGAARRSIGSSTSDTRRSWARWCACSGNAGWEVAVEVSFSIYGERGSIDVLGWHPVTTHVAVVEVKASVPEAGATVIGVDRKSRLAPAIARDRGWPCAGVARFLVVADGSTSRDRITRHQDVFRTAFPADGRACLSWICDPRLSPPSGIIFLVPRDAAARRRAPPLRDVRGADLAGRPHGR